MKCTFVAMWWPNKNPKKNQFCDFLNFFCLARFSHFDDGFKLSSKSWVEKNTTHTYFKQNYPNNPKYSNLDENNQRVSPKFFFMKKSPKIHWKAIYNWIFKSINRYPFFLQKTNFISKGPSALSVGTDLEKKEHTPWILMA